MFTVQHLVSQLNLFTDADFYLFTSSGTYLEIGITTSSHVFEENVSISYIQADSNIVYCSTEERVEETDSVYGVWAMLRGLFIRQRGKGQADSNTKARSTKTKTTRQESAAQKSSHTVKASSSTLNVNPSKDDDDGDDGEKPSKKLERAEDIYVNVDIELAQLEQQASKKKGETTENPNQCVKQEVGSTETTKPTPQNLTMPTEISQPKVESALEPNQSNPKNVSINLNNVPLTKEQKRAKLSAFLLRDIQQEEADMALLNSFMSSEPVNLFASPLNSDALINKPKNKKTEKQSKREPSSSKKEEGSEDK